MKRLLITVLLANAIAIGSSGTAFATCQNNPDYIWPECLPPTTTVPETTTTSPATTTTVPETTTTVPATTVAVTTTVPATTIPATTVPETTVPEVTTTVPATFPPPSSIVDPCSSSGGSTLFYALPCGPDNPPLYPWCLDPANLALISAVYPSFICQPPAVSITTTPTIPEPAPVALPETGTNWETPVLAGIFVIAGLSMARLARRRRA